jgi:hypothetical protein
VPAPIEVGGNPCRTIDPKPGNTVTLVTGGVTGCSRFRNGALATGLKRIGSLNSTGTPGGIIGGGLVVGGNLFRNGACTYGLKIIGFARTVACGATAGLKAIPKTRAVLDAASPNVAAMAAAAA